MEFLFHKNQLNRFIRLNSFSKFFVVAFVLTLPLASCGDSAKRTFGLERQAPDEFAVIKRAPLSKPPDFKLRPPKPGAERPGVASPREQARNTVFQRKNTNLLSKFKGNQFTEGEKALLKLSGADKVETNIRARIDRESSILAEADMTFILKLLKHKPEKGIVVDANKESQRLMKNKELGKEPTEGLTPYIGRKSKQLLKLF